MAQQMRRVPQAKTLGTDLAQNKWMVEPSDPLILPASVSTSRCSVDSYELQPSTGLFQWDPGGPILLVELLML
jgi:hypothetical protein